MNTRAVYLLLLSAAPLRHRAAAAPSPPRSPSPHDWRDVVRGGQLLSSDPGQYYNQPQLVQLRNGSWSMVLTNAGFKEGETNQRVVARFHREPDLRAGTWSAPVDIEAQPFGPSSGWAVPLYAPAVGGACGRLYAIYTYNGENITTLPASSGGAACRCQLVGGQWFRYSDDAGATWSRRHAIPIRSSSIDRMNPWGGRVLQGWTVSKPITMPSGAVLLPYTKIGTYVQAHERQWALRSPDVLRQQNASNVSWETWPAADGGPTQGCPPLQGDVAEEGGILSLGGARALFLFRTANGNINECVSDDDGRSWRPRPVRYASAHRGAAAASSSAALKSPRGPLTARRLADGTYALLYFCNGWKGYSGAANNTRNPYFLTLGRLTAGGDDIEWAQPEIALYGRGWLPGAVSPAYNLAYPDLVQQADGSVVVFAVFESPPGSACNRSEFLAIGGCGVSAHVVPPPLLSGLRAQLSNPTPAPHAPAPGLVNRSLLLDVPGAAHAVAAPAWPDLDQWGQNGTGSGITIEWWQDAGAASGGGDGHGADGGSSIFSCAGADGAGILIAPAPGARDGSIEVRFTAPGGQPVLSVKSEPGLLSTAGANRSLHLAVVVDSAPQMVYFHRNGRFCDGGDNNTFGYTFFRRLPPFWSLTGQPQLCNASASRTRVYGSYLTTSELVLNDRTSR